MSSHKLFVENTNGKKKVIGNSMSTTYLYDPKRKTLKVFWKYGSVIKLNNVNEGDPIWVGCWGDAPEVRRVRLPRRKADCLAWLLDFPKETRTHSEEEYEDLLRRQRVFYGWWNYEEYTSRERGRWAITLCNRSDCGGVYHVACFISDEAAEDKDSVKNILEAWSRLRWMYFPKTFVCNVLRKHFGFSEADLEEVDECLGNEH